MVFSSDDGEIEKLINNNIDFQFNASDGSVMGFMDDIAKELKELEVSAMRPQLNEFFVSN